ncbi:hypothetical protein CVT24_013098 [Panaeolus cyanescens]|uniref:DUF6533 domain-containing protein n=1 Tax=Panaeolus cyanescens TaxID=181874 RepID=A0A409YN38_9AGAR|nr:hypothetical protein CVT24_013098 [Panaeolus cyanescens]
MSMDPATLQAIRDQLPNPFTPMAFLPPDLAFQVMISLYTIVGSLAVMIWDMATNIGADYRLLTQYRIGPSTIIYFISRWASLAYLLALTILETAPVDNCYRIRWIQILFPLAIPFTSLLFFLRVQALYDRNKWVVGFFGILWLSVLGGCITPIFGIRGSNIGITKYCINSSLEPYVSAAAITPFINDTLVFIATTYRLMQNAHAEEGLKNKAKVAFLGHKLPVLSKALLLDGQAYYLTTISLNLVTASLFFNTSIPIVYRSFIGVPNIVLMNAMACHVFRNVKFGVFRASTIASNRTLPSRAPYGSAVVFPSNQTTTLDAGTRGGIQVMTTTEVFELDNKRQSSTEHLEQKSGLV